MLLFDKLMDAAPYVKEEHPVKQNYSKEELLLSVQREVELLLNSRCKLTFEEYKSQEVQSYGMPNLFGMIDNSMKGKGGERALKEVCTLVREAVKRFEPRFSSVFVNAKKNHTDFGYIVEISGTLLVGDKEEMVHFPLSVSSDTVSLAKQESALYNQRKPGLKWAKDKEGNGVDKS